MSVGGTAEQGGDQTESEQASSNAGVAAQTRPAEDRHAKFSDDEVLPAVLQDFLARYPHPAFALRASSIFDALVVRANQFAPTGKAAFSRSSHSDSDPRSSGSPGQGEASRHPAEEGSGGSGEGDREDDRAARPTRPQRLTSQEQYEGTITEEERIEREQDLRDERDAQNRADAGEAQRITAGGSGSRVEADGFFPSGASARPPSSLAAPSTADAESQASAYGDADGADSPFPPSVSRGETPSLATAASSVCSYRARDIGPHPRAHARAERVLAETFSDDAPAYGRYRRLGDRPLDRHTLLEGGEQKNHDPSRTAEGAVTAMYEQLAQQARDDKEEDDRATRDEEEYERARQEDEEQWDREAHTSARMRNHSIERKSSDGTTTAAASPHVDGHGEAGAARSSSSKAQSASDRRAASEPHRKRARLPRQRSGPTVGLREMLSPVWRNSKWSEMMAIRKDPHSTPSTPQSEPADASDTATSTGRSRAADELELLSVLSRTDAQECLAMLASVVETLLPSRASESERQAKIPLAKLNHTVLVELNFPESSIYRHPPGSSFHHVHTAADSFASDATAAGTSLFFSPSVSAAQEQRRNTASPVRDGSPSEVTRKALKGELPIHKDSPDGSRERRQQRLDDARERDAIRHGADNPTAIGRVIPANAAPVSVPPSNQNPAVPPPHHAIQQESHLLRPFIQIVATLYEEYDLVVCTTISGNMPLPVTITGSPEGKDAEESRHIKAGAKERAREQRAREKASRERQAEQYDEETSRRQREAECHLEEDLPNGAVPFAELETNDDLPRSPVPAPSARGIADDSTQSSGTITSGPEAEGVPIRRKDGPIDVPGRSMPSKSSARPSLAQRFTSTSNTSVRSDASTVMNGSKATSRTRSDSDPSYTESGLTTPDSPTAMTGDLRALLSGDIGTEPPFDFLQEKEARAAMRRRGVVKAGSSSGADAVSRDRHQDPVDRSNGPPSSAGDRSSVDELGRNELADVTEGDETEISQRDAVPPARSQSGSTAVLGYDEEDDDRDLDRLRRATRTGSYSSQGSDRARNDARFEAQLVQDQHDEDEDKLKIRRRIQEEHDSEEAKKENILAREHDEQTSPDESAHAETEAAGAASRAPPRRSSRSASLPQPFDTGSHSVLVGQHGDALAVEPVSEDQLELSAPETPISSPAPHPSSDPFFEVLASTECGRTIVQIDWSRTPLGPIGKWAPELRSHIMATLASPFHTALWYGEENVLLYNDAYARLLGAKHPAAMGKSAAEGWSEVWDVIGPLASQVMLGRTMFFQDQVYCIYRNGMLEETYMTWAYISLRDGRGRIIGYSNVSVEVTARAIAERRLGTLRELSQLTQLSRTSQDFWSKALRALSSNGLDVPFAIAYSCETLGVSPGRAQGRTSTGSSSAAGPQTSNGRQTTTSTSTSAAASRVRLSLQGSIGVPKGHPSAPDEISCLVDNVDMQDLPEHSSMSSTSSTNRTNSSGTTSSATASSTVWPVVEVLQNRKPIFISDLGDRSSGFTTRGWPDRVSRAVVIPILVEGTNIPKAVLIVGLNSRRPWNTVYSTFLSLITRTLSQGLLGIDVAEEQARKSKELAELNDARQAFFANVSHELRTPLTLILGPIEDLLTSKSANLGDEDRHKLEMVQRNANRLHKFVNTLLDFSRLDSGKMNATFRPTKLGPKVAELAGLFRPAIERGGVKYVVDVAEDKWAERKPFYLADELIDKIVMNLISNAYKYCLEGSIEVRVRFFAGEGHVSIKDSGVGIKDEDLPKIFDRFHRAESNARSFEGTGIGLSLVLELVRTLGGTIDVDSRYGQGSRFTVRLPRGKKHLPAEHVVEEPYETMSLPPRTSQSLSLVSDASAWIPAKQALQSAPSQDDAENPIDDSVAIADRVSLTRKASERDNLPSVFNLKKADTVCLIVDDNAQLRSFISGLLAKSFTVVEAANGQEALEYAKSHPVSIVLTDLAMPVMNGRELLAALRNDPATSLIPLIFLSAQAGSEARVEALLLGADDYITKPFQPRELMARVWTHLQIGEMRRELDRRVAERTAALIESERRFKDLADQHQTLALVSPVGILQIDRKGRVVFANPRFFDISDQARDGDYDKWQDLICEDDQARVQEVWKDALQKWAPSGEVTITEFRFRCGKWVQLELRPFEKGFIAAITDISHTKEVEASHVKVVEQRAADAEENRRNTEAFLDMSSHELRNPLSGVWQNAEVVSASLEKITGWLEELEDFEGLDQSIVKEMHDEMVENLDAIESIQICASHQTRIADDILNVSKLNMGLLSINVAPFDLTAATREVVRTFGTSAQQQQIDLSVDRGESLDRLGVSYIVADEGRCKQVLYNFLTNALKYTKPAKIKKVTVHIDAYDRAPPEYENAMRISAPNRSFEPPPGCIWCVVGVEDSGKGLTSDELSLLFARFSQANPRSDQYGGSGLGLYVSRKLIELHRGFIEVASVPGHGSTFRFAIPAQRAQKPAQEVDAEAKAKEAAADRKHLRRPLTASTRAEDLSHPSSTGAPALLSTSPGLDDSKDLPPLRILIVEDNLINQKVMTRQLKQQGLEVTVANDGQQALDALRDDEEKLKSSTNGAEHNIIRVVLMDIEMPVMDGLTAIRELRRREKDGEMTHHYPVCAVTGNAREAQKTECLEAGFDDVAIKPYRIAQLLEQISTLSGFPLPSPK